MVKTLLFYLQVVLNFIALNYLLLPVANVLIPVAPISAFLSLIYWGIILLVAYLLADYLKKS